MGSTEQPTVALLERHPFKKDSHLITKILWRFVFGHSIYQLVALILTLAMADEWLGIDCLSGSVVVNGVSVPCGPDEYKDYGCCPGSREVVSDLTGRYTRHLTVVFNVFVWMQIFNEINARKVNNERNVFEGIHKNWIFWMIIAISIVAQFILIEVGGQFASTLDLNATEWGYSNVLFKRDLEDAIQINVQEDNDRTGH